MIFTNEDKILVKVLRQSKDYSAKNWIHFPTGNDRVHQWTNCCIRLTQRVLQPGSTAVLAENALPARVRTLTLLKNLFLAKKMHTKLMESCARHFDHINDITVNLTFPYW